MGVIRSNLMSRKEEMGEAQPLPEVDRRVFEAFFEQFAANQR